MSSPLGIALGKDIAGVAQVADLCKMPHLLIAGSTGSGKSVCVNSIIMSLVFRSSPEDVKLLLIDPKVVELAEYNGIPHLLMPVVTEPKKAAGHMKHIGHPLFGDERYGGMEILRGERSATYKAFINNCFKACSRQALHARTLGFVHPKTKQQMDFTSEWPDDFAQLIEKWRGYMKGTTRDTFSTAQQ